MTFRPNSQSAGLHGILPAEDRKGEN